MLSSKRGFVGLFLEYYVYCNIISQRFTLLLLVKKLANPTNRAKEMLFSDSCYNSKKTLILIWDDLECEILALEST